MSKEALKSIFDFIKVSTFTFDSSHDINHAKAVYKSTLQILDYDKEDYDIEIATYSSLLHDICDHKYPNSISM